LLTTDKSNEMTENAIQPTDVTTSYSGRVRGNIWQHQTVNGEVLWSWITWAFTAYWILFVAGAFLKHKEMNVFGGVVILGVLTVTIVERLWVRLDAVVIASLIAAACLPIVQNLVLSPPTPEALFKHVSLCLVMAASRILQLPTASKSKMRWVLVAQILTILLISLTIFKGASWDGGTRHSGLFVNPNNLALIPFLLLFFINPLKDKWFIRVVVHGIVMAVLAFSGTTGAVLAYAIGLSVHLSSMVSKTLRLVVYGTAVFGGLAGVAFLVVGAERFLPETRLTNQITVMSVQFQTVLDGGNVAYYEQERVLGPGSASGIWRLVHWRRTIATYLDGTFSQQLFGFGIGSSPRLLGALPHNEYLRILLEQGIVGFLLFVFAWKRIITTAPAEVRYIGLIVAIYSFSENNLDNFPFMALFVLCLSARNAGDAAKAGIKRLGNYVERGRSKCMTLVDA
jgi:O-antigen ligase